MAHMQIEYWSIHAQSVAHLLHIRTTLLSFRLLSNRPLCPISPWPCLSMWISNHRPCTLQCTDGYVNPRSDQTTLHRSRLWTYRERAKHAPPFDETGNRSKERIVLEVCPSTRLHMRRSAPEAISRLFIIRSTLNAPPLSSGRSRSCVKECENPVVW